MSNRDMNLYVDGYFIPILSGSNRDIKIETNYRLWHQLHSTIVVNYNVVCLLYEILLHINIIWSGIAELVGMLYTAKHMDRE